MKKTILYLLFFILMFWGMSCSFPTVIQEPTNTVTFTLTPSLTPTITLTPTNTYTPTPTFTLTETPFPEPEGCLRPPDDMTMIYINGHKFNQRTYSMLLHAAELYGGEQDIAFKKITQGSYTSSEPLSFGTHAGGGAVDISVVDTSGERWVVLEDEEIEKIVYAMRVAGFAAWLRVYGELSPTSPIHIHAIAIGDPELSSAAQNQLAGPFGYFRGYSGIPQDDGIPEPDRHDGPIICKWMVDMGFSDLRETP